MADSTLDSPRAPNVAQAVNTQADAHPFPPLPGHSATVTIVRVPKPWYAPGALVARRMRATVDEYLAIAGLRFKVYTLSHDGYFGGIYLWSDLAAAQAWFGPAWFQRVRDQRGVEPEVRFFRAAMVIDNVPGGVPENLRSRAVATLAAEPVQARETDDERMTRFRRAADGDRQIAGLLRRYYLIAPDGRTSIASLWRSPRDARLHSRDETREVEWYDAPILLPTQASSHLTPT